MKSMMKKLSSAAVGAVDSIEKGTPVSGRTLARMPEPTNRMASNNPRALNNNPRGSNLPNDNRMGGAISRGVDLRESVFKGNAPQIGLQKTQPASTRSMSGISNAASKKMQPSVVNASAPRKSSSVMGKMAGAVATASKKMQPALGRAAAKPAIGAALQKKPIGKVLGRGLVGLKKRP